MESEYPVEPASAFDLIVIGAGSGNSLLGPDTDDLRIALLDDGEWFGGTCLTAGCIPTKMFVRVADVVDAVDEGDRIGVEASLARPDWATVRDRVFGRIDAISAGGLHYRAEENENVTVYRETFGFEDAHTLVSTSGTRITAPRIVVAAGSRPKPLLAVYDAADPAVHDSSSIMRIAERPGRLLVLGGGAVAAEFAHVFDAFGTEVTIVLRGDRMLSDQDETVSTRFTAHAAERHDVRTGVMVEEIERVPTGDGGSELVATLSDGSTVATDAVLVALGRTPNTDTLNAAGVGFDLESDGRLSVDEYQRVLSDGQPVAGLFALGDISNPYQLKHVANHEARLVAHNLAHPDDLIGGAPGPVPAAVFAAPQVASFGVTQQQARAEGLDVVVVHQEFASTAFGWALEDDSSVCVLVVALDGQLLGAHIIGPEASILLQTLVQAASSGRTVVGLARGQYWPHPAATEVVENALLSAEELLRDRATSPTDDGTTTTSTTTGGHE